jgi:predicted deacylase
MGKKILLFEGGKTNSIDETIVEEGLLGIQRILNHFNMKNFKLEQDETEPIIIKSSKWLRAPLSGVFHAVVKNGQFVERGEVIGFVSDPYGSSERKVKSNSKGYIICTNEALLVNKGDAIFHIGRALMVEKVNRSDL